MVPKSRPCHALESNRTLIRGAVSERLVHRGETVTKQLTESLTTNYKNADDQITSLLERAFIRVVDKVLNTYEVLGA